MSRRRVGIVGGGISGLAAAWHLCHELGPQLPGCEIVLVDASDRPGGKLRAASVAGIRIDVGAESMLARRPEAVQLALEVGLAERIVHPVSTAASIWSRGSLHPMPGGTLMGVPSNPAAALGVLDAEEVARAESERVQSERSGRLEPVDHDLSVGELVAARVGPAVVDRLVEPLLGGVYAGHARQLSLQATVPQLWEAAATGEPITVAAERHSSLSVGNPTPVFAGITGGLATLAETLTASLLAAGVQLRSNAVVRSLERTPAGWRLVMGPVPAPEVLDVDAVILAVPAAPAARLLSAHSPSAAGELTAIGYASMAIVSIALPRRGLPHLPGSGLLVPPVEGRRVKASTFSSNKWAWLADAAPDLSVLRASLGRYGEEADLQHSDHELVATALADLSDALGSSLPAPADTQVQRWGGALPQYTVGHLERVRRIRAAVADLAGLEVAGAAYDGVGIPACIASGRRAAASIQAHLRSKPAAG